MRVRGGAGERFTISVVGYSVTQVPEDMPTGTPYALVVTGPGLELCEELDERTRKEAEGSGTVAGAVRDAGADADAPRGEASRTSPRRPGPPSYLRPAPVRYDGPSTTETKPPPPPLPQKNPPTTRTCRPWFAPRCW